MLNTIETPPIANITFGTSPITAVYQGETRIWGQRMITGLSALSGFTVNVFEYGVAELEIYLRYAFGFQPDIPAPDVKGILRALQGKQVTIQDPYTTNTFVVLLDFSMPEKVEYVQQSDRSFLIDMHLPLSSLVASASDFYSIVPRLPFYYTPID